MPPPPPLLLRGPTLSRTRIVFSFTGHLWSVPRDGGEAQQVTFGDVVETGPQFSPDGTQIAYTGLRNGNPDVYVVSAGGGAPRRLTYHPGPDQVLGWTPVGRRVLFCSPRSSYSRRFQRLFTVLLANSWRLGPFGTAGVRCSSSHAYSLFLGGVGSIPVECRSGLSLVLR